MTRWLWYPIFSFYFGTFCRRISFCVRECIWNMYLRVPVHCATSWCRMCKFELVSKSSRALQGMSLLVHIQRNKYVTLYRLAAIRFTLRWHCYLLWRHQLSWLLWSVVVMEARYLFEEDVVTLLNASDSERVFRKKKIIQVMTAYILPRSPTAILQTARMTGTMFSQKTEKLLEVQNTFHNMVEHPLRT